MKIVKLSSTTYAIRSFWFFGWWYHSMWTNHVWTGKSAVRVFCTHYTIESAELHLRSLRGE